MSYLTLVLTLLKGGWKGLTSNPWRTTSLALLVALGVFFVKAEVYKHELATCESGRSKDRSEWDRQVAAAKAATAKAKQDGKDTANGAETYHAQLSADTGKLADYVAPRRVQPRPGAPASASGGDDPAVHADAPAVPAVAVPVSALESCDADYTYAAAAYRLGQDLIAKGLAEPEKGSQDQPDTDGQKTMTPGG